jgi:hypothetical protein
MPVTASCCLRIIRWLGRRGRAMSGPPLGCRYRYRRWRDSLVPHGKNGASPTRATRSASPSVIRSVRAHWIEQAAPLPRVLGDYPLFLPRAGVDGNAIAGIRQPLLAAPRATYTGWNPITGATGTQDLCTQMGGTLPFALTAAERQEGGDPRPSIEELYRAPDDYVAAVQAATERLVTERLLLPEDAEAAISAARAGTLAKLAR